MRTKNLLLSAAALVAGALSVQAQSNVYSVNVVGYVNQVYPANQYALVAPPLNTASNTLNNFFATLPNFATVSVWNGSGFTTVTKIAGSFTPNLTIDPGTGVFVRSASARTNTWVGEVLQGSLTNAVPAGYSLQGDLVPKAETLNEMGLAQVLPNFSQISRWNGTSYTTTTKIAGSFTPNPVIQVGEGFFINKAGTTGTNYVRTFSVE